MSVPLIEASLIACTLGILGCPVGAFAADIEVKIIHFGAGDVARGSGPLAVQVEFRSALDRVVELEAVWELPNADLDIAEHSRTLVLNPGQASRRWLYGELPPMGEGSLATAVFDLRLYELVGGERARDLGTAKIASSIAENAPRILPPEQDAILVIGARTAGLDIFAQASANGAIPSMNTVTAIANARDTDSLPDAWNGYAMFDAVVWASGAILPSRLSEESTRALTQWTERGGNFIIAIPAAGDPWSIGSTTRHGFSELLPSTPPRRVDDVELRDILPLLSLSDTLRNASVKTRLAIFDPATLDRSWRPFIAFPAVKDAMGEPTITADSIDGALVGIRRELGLGHMTVLGIDVDELAARGLQTPAIPQGDVFWNRILGRRADSPSGAEYVALDEATRLAGSGGYARTIGDGAIVASEIGLAGEAAIGILAATAVFALYWLLAGPLGFAFLKMMKKERWAWVAYVGVAVIFTVGIWLIGNLFAGSAARIRHLTVLDMVARAPGEADITVVQRKLATGWLSLYAPEYGSVEIALDPAADPSQRNTLTSWRAVGSDPQSFPTRERYRVALDEPARISVPARATAIDFEAHWLGSLDAQWGEMPAAQEAVTVVIDRETNPATVSIAGTLVHQLPAALTDVLITHIWPVRNPLQTMNLDTPPTRRWSAQLPNRGVMKFIPQWKAGETLDLNGVFPPEPVSDRLGLERTIATRYYEPLYKASQINTGFGITGEALNVSRAFEMLSLYSMLQPPPYLRNPPENPELLRVPRTDGRDLDLSAFFTQPCLIIMGTLDAVTLPYPLTVDGEVVESKGRVIVRWIMPLPANYATVVPEKIPRASRPAAEPTATPSVIAPATPDTPS